MSLRMIGYNADPWYKERKSVEETEIVALSLFFLRK